MKILNKLLSTLPDGRVLDVTIGLHWTAVVVEVEGQPRCGLASTLHNDHQHGTPDVVQAGTLEKLPALRLAKLVLGESATTASVGMAAINALLPQYPETWVDLNAEEVIAEKGLGKDVVLVGHFPFVPQLEARVGKLSVLELEPRPGDLPVSAAEEVVPPASVLAITSMTLINQTLEPLLALRDSQTCTILLGPSTPLSPLLYDYGFDILCGAVVTEIDPVIKAVKQGANFRQVHRAGVRLVSITKNGEGLF
jgi:uncharacterized protein (DUF4213/DUF364 family)